jgi:putative peptide zinc metalloprotease protein
LASCSDCKTVAVAFQVILVIGQSDRIAPVNTAAAANYECAECVTHAIAVQLVATLNGVPSAEVEHQLAVAWSQLDDLTASIEQLSVSEIYGALLAVEQTVLEVLTSDGPVDSTSTSQTAGPTSGTETGPTGASVPGDPTTEAATAPADATAAPNDPSSPPPVTEESTPTPSAEPTDTPEPSAEPTPDPSAESSPPGDGETTAP